MASSRELREEIKSFQRDRDFQLMCKISDEQYQLLQAIHSRNLDKFKYLINKGVSPSFRNDAGETPLHKLVSLDSGQVAIEMLKLLVHIGMVLETTDRFGQTPLHIASERCPRMVEILLQAGANVNVQDNAGRTPLMHACSSNHGDSSMVTIVHYLIDMRCNVYSQDQEGHTALHCVCLSKKDSRVKNEISCMLLNSGLSATVPDRKGKMAACYEIASLTAANVNSQTMVNPNKLMLIRTLVRAGSTLNCRSKQQESFIKVFFNYNYHARSSSPLCLQLLQEFKPVLSLPAIKKIRSLIPKDIENSELRSSLQDMSCNVQTLKFLSRLAIRTELKGKVLMKVDSLPLPRTLKEYVLIEDDL